MYGQMEYRILERIFLVANLDEGTKFDEDKIRLDLVAPEFINSIAEILTFGARKYTAHNWKRGIKYQRVYRACIGHLLDWYQGEELDSETGKPHLWHAGCCLMFLIYYEIYSEEFAEFDDRAFTHSGQHRFVGRPS